MIKHKIKVFLQRFPIFRELLYCDDILDYYKNENSISKFAFFANFFLKTKVIVDRDKCRQICALIRKVDINCYKDCNFFYSLDPFKKIYRKDQVLDNYSIDYAWVVRECIGTQLGKLKDGTVKNHYLLIKNSLEEYVIRLKKT